MTYIEFFRELCDIYADELDREFIRGIKLLSQRKKNKFRKWVMKALEKERKKR